MIRLKNKHDMRRDVGRLFRSVMVGALLLNYIPIVSLTGIQQIQAADSTPAAAPDIQKDIAHTSRYIQSGSTYSRGLREYVTAASTDGGVLSYAWFINTEDKYLDGSDDASSAAATDAKFGVHTFGDGNSDYQGSFGTQSSTSNILVATTPETVGTYYTYVEITNTKQDGTPTTIRSKRAKLDIRSEDKLDKPRAASNVKIAPEFSFPAAPTISGNSLVGARNNPVFGAFDSTLFYTYVSKRTANLWNNSLDGDLQAEDPGWLTSSIQKLVTMEYQKSANTGNRWTMDTNCVGSSSVYQDISTIPGAIYDVNFEHYSIADAASDGDVLAATIAPSKFSSGDYANDIPNRYWDGSKGIGSAQGLNDPQSTYYFKNPDSAFTGSHDLTSENVGKYPYGLNPGAQNLPTSGDPVVQPNILGSRYGTDYFFDMTRYAMLGLYKGDSNQVYDFDLKNSTNTSLNKTAIATAAKTSDYANAKKVFTYGGEKIVQFYSRDNLQQSGQSGLNKKQFYYTVPEGQGATVEAFSSVANTSDVNDNGIYNVNFNRISKPDISKEQFYNGGNTITVNSAKADYVYALVDVSQGYAQLIGDVSNYAQGAAINPSLGSDSNWFTTSNSSFKFKDLVVGRTYRVIAIPQGAIQPETDSNMSPLDVIDTDAWVDTTIAVPSVDGSIQGGTYKDGATIKGQVTINQANANNVYALLKLGSDKKPLTNASDVVKTWVAPVNGSVVFNDLTLTDGDNPYVVIAKPSTFFNFDYEDATYSPTEVYKTGDTPPDGFNVGDPVMVGTPVTITKDSEHLSLGVTEVTRTPHPSNPALDNITITYQSDYRGGGTQFPDKTTAIAYDKALGTLAGLANTGGADGQADLSNQDTATFTVPAGTDYEVVLQFDKSFGLSISALAAPELLKVDYENEGVLADTDSSYARLNAIDYNLMSGSHYYVGDLTTRVQASNTQAISLTSALDDTDHPYNVDGKLTYTKHLADATRMVGVSRTLDIKKRPDALTHGTTTGDVQVDYLTEVVKNASGGKILLTTASGTVAVDDNVSTTFASLGWTGNADLALSSRLAATSGDFKGKVRTTTLVKRPAAPVRADNEGVSVTISGSNAKFSNNYATGTLIVTGKDDTGQDLPLSAEIAAKSDSDFTGHADGNIYSFVFKATTDAPRSQALEYATPLVVSKVDFGDVPYGELGPKTAQTGDASTKKQALKLENTGENTYYFDAVYDNNNNKMKFNNLGLFGFTNKDSFIGYGGLLTGAAFNTLAGAYSITKGVVNENFTIVLGDVLGDPGNWTPALTEANNDGTPANSNSSGNINKAPVGTYTSRLNLAYSTNSDLSGATTISSEVKINIVKAKWATPVVATQAPTVASGSDAGLDYTVTKEELSFDVLLDEEVSASTLEVTTNSTTWVKPTLENGTGSVSVPAGKVLKRITLRKGSDGADIQPGTTYNVQFRVIGDSNHNQSDSVTKTFYTRMAEPTTPDAFVNYTLETLVVDGAHSVKIGTDTAVSPTGTSVTAAFVPQTPATPKLTLHVTTLAQGNYPASVAADFEYSRQAKPTLSVTDETVYNNRSGAISGTATIDVKNISGNYGNYTQGNTINNLYSGEYLARTPASSTAFASEEVKVLLVPDTYNVRVKSAAVLDASIGNLDYARESDSSLYFKKTVPQDYTNPFTDATFSRIGYNPRASAAVGSPTFTTGGDSVVMTDSANPSAYNTALDAYNKFLASIDTDAKALTRKITWKTHEAPTYTVTIPALINGSTTGTSADVKISAWENKKRTIPLNSKINLKVADANSWVLTNAGTNMAYNLTLGATQLDKKSVVQSMTASDADAIALTAATDATQAFTTTVTGTPQVAGNYTGAITFEVDLELPENEE